MRILGVVVAGVLLAEGALSQSSASLTGYIHDATGAPVPDVAVSIRATATEFTQRTKTGEEGGYTINGLAPREYVVTAELDGFKRVVSKPLKLDAGAAARLDLVLVPADSRQIIEVSADPPLLETQSGALQSTISEKELEALPAAGRNAMELALLLPGVGGDAGMDEGGIFQDVPTAGSGLIVGGGRAGSSAILADGVSASSSGIGRATVTFTPDTVQEFQVITNNFSARYGSSGGGIINTVPRSGSNQWRGTLYWYHRNPALHARQFNRPLPSQQRRHEIGLTLGGPVVIPKLYNGRRRTFFFFSAEPKRYFDAIDIYQRFPTAEERQGDFRNSYLAPGQRRPLLYQQVRCWPQEADCRLLTPIHRPSSTAEYPLWSLTDPDASKRGLVIPKRYIDPLVTKILEEVPLPNMPFDAQGRNYFGTRGVNGSSSRWNLKVDHNIASANRFSVRYTEVPNYSDRYRIQKNNLFFSYPSDRSITRQTTLNDTHTFSPAIVNEFRASYTFSDYSRSAPGELATTNFTREKFGLPNQTGWGYPQFNSGLGTYGLDLGATLGTYIEHQYQLSDDVTMNRGKHTFSIGGDLRLLMLNVKSTGLRDQCCGTYAWAAAQTNSGNANTPGGTGGFQFASFLLGVPNSVTLRSVVIPYYYRWKVASAYFQDDWKIAPRFTLNLGLRWQYNPPRFEKYNRQATIDLSDPVEITDVSGNLRSVTFNYLYSGFGGRSIYLEQAHKTNFEPRFGFAWSPPVKLGGRPFVVRGGYGISHTPVTGGCREPVPDFGAGNSGAWGYTRWANNNPPALTQSQEPRYLIGIGRNKPVMRVDPTVLEIPGTGVLCQNCPPARDARVPGGASILFAPDSQAPYIQTWNLTAEVDLARRWVLSLSYLGSKGTHLYGPLVPINNPDPILFEELLNEGGDPNELVPDPFGRLDASGNPINTAVVNLMRPFPTAGDMNIAGVTNSNSIYHAGTASIERRYAGGFMLRWNYGWSKSIDTSSDGNLSGGNLYLWGASRVQNAYDLRSERSVSLFDTRHRINFSTIIDLPFGKRRKFLANAGKLPQFFAGGWTVSGTGTIVSGLPFTVFLNDANGVPGGQNANSRIRPDMVSGVPLINPRWSKNVANDVPYFNPEAFARPAFGNLGNAPRTLDYLRLPWRQTLNAAVYRDYHPFEQRRRSIQLRADFYNVLNHVIFQTDPGQNLHLFSSAPPVSRTGLSLAGPMPYLVGLGGASFPIGTRENILAANYNQNFGKLWRDRNGPGRVVQLALKVYF